MRDSLLNKHRLYTAWLGFTNPW